MLLDLIEISFVLKHNCLLFFVSVFKKKLFWQTLGLVLRLRVDFVLPLSQEEQEEQEQEQEK